MWYTVSIVSQQGVMNMTDQEIKDKFNTLTEAQQRKVHDAANIIKECGADGFWHETGQFVDDPDSYWVLREMAISDLKL
jgi:hypothetical protein